MTNNYADLQNFLDYNDSARTDLGLQPGDNVDEWITAWNGDKETQKNFLLTVACMDDENAVTSTEAAECLDGIGSGAFKLVAIGTALAAVIAMF